MFVVRHGAPSNLADIDRRHTVEGLLESLPEAELVIGPSRLIVRRMIRRGRTIMRIVTFLFATALAAPAFAQEAGGEIASGSSPTCSLLAELDEADARLFMQGYLAGRLDAFGSLPRGDAPASADAATDQVEIAAGPSGAASPVGSPAEPAPVSPNLETPTAGSTDADPDVMPFSLASLDALVDSAVTSCETDPGRRLIEVSDEADPRGPIGAEPGLAGGGAPPPD